jgi:hypothetical protein
MSTAFIQLYTTSVKPHPNLETVGHLSDLDCVIM